MRTLCTIKQWWHFAKKKKTNENNVKKKKKPNENTLEKTPINNENALSTIYEFNTSSEFRGFMYILNYVDASNTCTSF